MMISKVFETGTRKRPNRQPRTKRLFRHESLEPRRLLANDLPNTISGTVFVDVDANNQLSDADKRLPGVMIELLESSEQLIDGETRTVFSQVATQTTDENGMYSFPSLDPRTDYVVRQIAQQVAERELEQFESSPMKLLTQNIDQFLSSQVAIDSESSPIGGLQFSSFVADEAEILGSERDLFVRAIQGDVSLNTGNGLLLFNASDNSIGEYTVQWDGIDGEENNALGLGGVDLTGGRPDAALYVLGMADLPNIGVSVRLYESNRVATSTRQALDTTSADYVFWSFSEGFQTPIDPTNVDAIELRIEPDPSTSDGVIEDIGVVAPRVVDLVNPLVADLAVTKTDNRPTAIPGDAVQYVVTVENRGPDDVAGVNIVDSFDSTIFSNVRFESSVDGDVVGHTVSGEGSLNETVTLPAGSSITYVITADIDAAAIGQLENRVTVVAPEGLIDPDENNNSAIDVDELEPEVDIDVSIDDGLDGVLPGDEVSYTVVITNNGPSVGREIAVESVVSDLLQDVVYSSTADEGVSGNSENGMGNLGDMLTMPPNASVTYTITGTLSEQATGEILTTVTAKILQTTNDGEVLVVAEETATDTNLIQTTVDLSIEVTNDVDLLLPGQPVTYTIRAKNNGATEAANVRIEDLAPVELTDISFTTEVTGEVSGHTPAGNDSIRDVVTLGGGAELVYRVTAVVAIDAVDNVTYQASIFPGESTVDVNPDDNVAQETDPVQPLPDLSIALVMITDPVIPGLPVEFQARVENFGPGDVDDVILELTLPAVLSDLQFTSTAENGATGNSAGTGLPTDVLQLPENSVVTYSIIGQLAPDALDQLALEAAVRGPEDLVERSVQNNVAELSSPTTPRYDIRVFHTAKSEFALFEGQAEFEIVVRNVGPSSATDVLIESFFPRPFVETVFSSQATGDAGGNSSGRGKIMDRVNLPANTSIQYDVTATVGRRGRTRVATMVLATPPSNDVDVDPENNSATARVELSTGLISRHLAVGDMNGDGFEDVVTVHEFSGRPADRQGVVAVMLGDGSGNFELFRRYRVGERPRSIAIGDINQDGSNDVVVGRTGFTASSRSSRAIVLLNRGDGVLNRRRALRTGNGPVFVTASDVDNDGDLDILSANARSNSVSLLRNRGRGRFGKPETIQVGDKPVHLAVADFNGDQRPDLAVAKNKSGEVDIYFGPLRGNMRSVVSLRGSGSPSSILAEDLDADGHVDIAVADYASDRVVIHYGRGNGRFLRPTRDARLILPRGADPTSVIAHDFDGDDRVDLAVAESSGSTIGLFLQTSQRQFADRDAVEVRPGPQAIALLAQRLLTTSWVAPGRANVFARDPSGNYVELDYETDDIDSDPSTSDPANDTPNETPDDTPDDLPNDETPSDNNDETPNDGTPDDGTPDDGTPDDGTPDDGTPDDGTPDDGTPDGGTPDGGTDDGANDGSADNGSTNGTEGVLRGEQPARQDRRDSQLLAFDDRFNYQIDEGRRQILDVLQNDEGEPVRLTIVRQHGPATAIVGDDYQIVLIFDRDEGVPAGPTVIEYVVQDRLGNTAAARVEVS